MVQFAAVHIVIEVLGNMHERPQLPQLFESVIKLVQAPEQQVLFAPAHKRPHMPQLRESELGFTHALPQHSRPAGQPRVLEQPT